MNSKGKRLIFTFYNTKNTKKKRNVIFLNTISLLYGSLSGAVYCHDLLLLWTTESKLSHVLEAPQPFICLGLLTLRPCPTEPICSKTHYPRYLKVSSDTQTKIRTQI